MRTHLQDALERALSSGHDRVVVSDGATLVHGNDLSAAAAVIQDALCGAGVEQGDRVLIELDRSVDYIAAVVACVRSGVTYVPVAANTPSARRTSIADHCAAAATISAGPEGPGVERIAEEIAGRSAGRHCDNPLAYIIYTSGTTGAPKGVAVSHSALWGFVSLDERIAMNSPESCLCCASVSFDATVYEIWPTLLGGGTLLLYSGDSVHLDELCGVISQTAPDRVFLTTKLFQAIEQSSRRDVLFSIGNLFVGGETISPQSFSRAREVMGDRLRAAYGPTEAVVFTTLEQSDGSFADEVPIGKAMRGKDVLVLDDQLSACSPGDVGEIFIRGGLADGYYANLAATATRFLPCPEGSGAVMYRSGDLGVVGEDGTITFRGRADHQVKIRGYRVELGAIESFYLTQSEISNCVCVVVDADTGAPKLCLYFVSTQARVNATTLRRRADSALEKYMIPDLFVQVEEFATSESGKIDRSLLPKPYLNRGEIGLSTEYSAPEGAVESTIAGLFGLELRIADVGADDNFYELGGNSLNSMSLLQSLSDAGLVASARELFSNPSPRKLATTISDRKENAGVGA
ncbi:non-ribosomal peptide synthetase [Rhodococcus sp. SJ-3]|uniref:non-ribosomal peptide synthetase n=1 Tax=Rhodococcus sp. SJ-3 TaxID=3454628 RepID=UPI003F791387